MMAADVRAKTSTSQNLNQPVAIFAGQSIK